MKYFMLAKSLHIAFLLFCSYASHWTSVEARPAFENGIESHSPSCESHDDVSMMQVPDMKVAQVQTDDMEQKLHSSKMQHPDRLELLHTGLLSKSLEPFLPVTVVLIVLGIFVAIYLAHRIIQAAFRKMPGCSCLLFYGLLIVLCWTTIPVLWSSTKLVLQTCGSLVLASACLALTLLMFTPMILVMPEKANKAKEPFEDNKQSITLLYLIFLALQVAAGVSIYLMAKVADASLSGPIMLTILYGILSWCSFSVLYERMLPHHSFAADFPSHIFGQAFMGQPKPPVDSSRLRTRLNRMKAALNAIEKQPNEQDVNDFHRVMSSALNDVYDDIMRQSVGIVDEAMKIQSIIDSTAVGFYIHFFLWLVYSVQVVVLAVWLVALAATVILANGSILAAVVLVVFTSLALLLLIAIYWEIIVNDASFIGYSGVGVYHAVGRAATAVGYAAGYAAGGAAYGAGVVASGVADGASTVGKGVYHGAGAVVGGAGAVAGKVAGGVANVARPVADGVADVAGTVAGGAGVVASGVADGASTVGKGVYHGAGAVVGGAGAVAGKVAGGVANVARPVADEVADVAGTVAGGAGVVASGVADGASTVGKGVYQGAGAVVGGAETVVGGVGYAAGYVAGTAADGVSIVAQGVYEGAGQAAGGVGYAAGYVAGTAVDVVEGTAQGVGSVAKGAYHGAGAVVDGVSYVMGDVAKGYHDGAGDESAGRSSPQGRSADDEAADLKSMEQLQQEMEAKIAEHQGRISSDPITSKADLASTLFKRGDFEGASRLYCEVYEARLKTFGPDHPETLTAKESWANALMFLGDVVNAEKYQREVWSMRIRVQGPEHPDTLSSKYRLDRCTERIV